MNGYKTAAAALTLLGSLAAGAAQASYLHLRPASLDGDRSDDAFRRTPNHGEPWHWKDRSRSGENGELDYDWGHCQYDEHSGVVYEDVQMVMSETHFTDWLYIREAGTYQGTLTDFGFPAPFSRLGLSINTGTSLLASLEAPGTFVFDAEPGRYYLSLFAVTDEETGYGQYGIKIAALSDEVSEVPLPSGLILLGSGLLGLTGAARRRC